MISVVSKYTQECYDRGSDRNKDSDVDSNRCSKLV